MRREWDARHEGGGRFRLRRRARWIGAPVLIGFVILAGGGAARRLWDRFTVWLWETAHLAPGTVLGAAVIAVVFTLLWRASR
ncbi:MAG TPA: hypothetical protein VIS06_15865 [Mycobacteriales bacterium]